MRRFLIPVLFVLMMVGCKDKTISVTGITMDTNTATIQAGETKQLTAMVIPTDADNTNVVWKSADDAIAVVSEGLVTAIAEGKTTITAITVDGGFAAEVLVSVIDVNEPIEPVYKYTYDFLGEDVMPIGAWVAPPSAISFLGNQDYITDQHFKNIAESGLNSIYALYELMPFYLDAVIRTLDLCEKNKLVYLVRDINPVINFEYYSDVNNYKSFGGVLVSDEPGTIHFDELAGLGAQFDPLFPDKLYYINMMPEVSQSSLVNGAQGGDVVDESIDYNKYIDLYLEKVKPKVLSYDFYPMKYAFPYIENGYFKQMSFIAEKARNAKIPFWVFIQSCSWAPRARICTLPEVLWQVNTALCYGCKGIQYFTYWAPLEWSEMTDEKIGSMISTTGEKQSMYYHVQTANKQVNAISEVLMNSVFKGIIKTGDFPKNSNPGEIPGKDLLTGYKVLKSVSGGNCLTGCFNHKGKPAYYVVNSSIENEALISLEFKGDIKFDVTISGVTESMSGESATISLSAGNAALITVK